MIKFLPVILCIGNEPYVFWPEINDDDNDNYYLALINRTGGLYGRILTEVISTDRTQ